METRANHLLVGGFVLLVVAGLFIFAIWLARVQIERGGKPYRIYFEESVAGLALGSDVRYRGIRTGAVTAISVDATDPSRVAVSVEIDPETEIREGDRASLRLQGITGLAYINIEGARAASAPLIAPATEKMPVIPATRSQIEQLVAGAPALINHSIVLAERAAELLNEDNRARFSSLLTNLDALTGTLSADRERIQATLGGLEHSIDEAATTLAALGSLSVRAERMLEQGGAAMQGADELITQLDATALAVEQMVAKADRVIDRNQEPLHIFATEGLSEFRRLVTETRLLVAALSRITERLENEGGRFFFGAPDAEFRPE
jgi:phospholipid/cholesterol/gamma-HCH transport system substrate-binding protein